MGLPRGRTPYLPGSGPARLFFEGVEMNCCPTCGQRVTEYLVLVDRTTNTIACRGYTIHAAPKPLELLALLLRCAPRAITKDLIIETVWGDHEPYNADKCIHIMIHKLRKVICPLGLEIETVHWRGYRLVGDFILGKEAA